MYLFRYISSEHASYLAVIYNLSSHVDRISVKKALCLPVLQMWKLRLRKVSDLFTFGAQVCPTAKPLFFPPKTMLGWAGPLCRVCMQQLLPGDASGTNVAGVGSPVAFPVYLLKGTGNSALLSGLGESLRGTLFFSLLVVNDHVKGKDWALK